MEFTLENIERAVCQFYQTDTVLQTQAHEFLNAAKVNPQAWIFVWDLLQPDKTTEVQFYGATTLYSKVDTTLNELPSEEIVALQDRLIERIIKYSNGPKLILNRLCITLSAYLLQVVGENWFSVVPEIIGIFTPERIPQVPPDRIIWILLEILSLLPEVCYSLTNVNMKRTRFQIEFEGNLGQIVTLVENVLKSSSNPEVTAQAVKCIAAWCEATVSFFLCHTIVNHLVGLVFNYHKVNSMICEKSLDALQSMVLSPDAHKYPTYLYDFLIKILPLREIIARELLCPDTTDQDLVRRIYSLLISFGENYSRDCLNWLKSDSGSREQVMALITALLHCCGAQGTFPLEETHSRTGFAFWYIFQDQVLSLPQPDLDFALNLLCPIYKELVDVLITKAQIPSGDQGLSLQDAELFRCYRQDIGDTLMYSCSILKSYILSVIKQRLDKISAEDEPKWQELEACLFSLSSIAENVNLEENEYLPSLFQFIRQLPFQTLNPKVLTAALDVYGAYAEWISANSSILEHVLPLIMLSLSIPDAAPNASMALKDLTRDCRTALLPYSSVILETTQEILRSGRLHLNEGMRIMYSVGRLLSILPFDNILRYLDAILTPYYAQLQQLSLQEPTAEVKLDIVTIMKLMGILAAVLDIRDGRLSSVTNPQPVFLILEKLLPVIKTVAVLWASEATVLQAIYGLLKYSVTTLLEESRPFIEEIVALIVSTYVIHALPEALDLTKQLCILFVNDERTITIMQNVLRDLQNSTLNRVSGATNLSDYTDILESFFTLLSNMLRKASKLFVYSSPEECIPLIQCATLTLGVPELITVKSAAYFLVNFITSSRELPVLSNALNVCGEQLLQKIMALIRGETIRANLEPLSEVLLALNKKYCDNTVRWLNKAVNELDCPNATQQHREIFVKSVIRERSNRRKIQDCVYEFSLICRGLVQFGVQSRRLYYFE